MPQQTGSTLLKLKSKAHQHPSTNYHENIRAQPNKNTAKQKPQSYTITQTNQHVTNLTYNNRILSKHYPQRETPQSNLNYTHHQRNKRRLTTKSNITVTKTHVGNHDQTKAQKHKSKIPKQPHNNQITTTPPKTKIIHKPKTKRKRKRNT